MPISVSYQEPDRFVLEGTGRITGAESIGAFEEVLRHPRFREGATLLAVAHHVTEAPPTDELRAIATAAIPLTQAGMRALAIVTAPGFTYGVARMFSVLADLVGVRVEVFLDVEDARRRLDELSIQAA